MKFILRTLTPYTALFLVCATPLYAQKKSPALVVKQGNAYEEMVLTQLEVDVRIHGFLAETTSTMTFNNPHNRVLEGDIYFPLPEGSTVNGYALDIEGRMVDGVAVEKERARVIFEKIVRQGIDPGLMEWTRGNNFKTRIFPIPAKGSRTIRVRYVSEIQSGKNQSTRFRLPLNFKQPIAQFELRVEVVRAEKPPEISAGAPANFSFKSWRSSYVAETALQDATLNEDLVIALPAEEQAKVLVEQASDGNTYFCIHDFPTIPKATHNDTAPQRLSVFWDASGSRAGRDHHREIDALDACLSHWSKKAKQPIDLTLTLLRDRAEFESELTIPVGTWAKSKQRKQLLETLRNVTYDGGTYLGSLLAPKSKTATERILLFTDGLRTFGKKAPKPKSPLYIFSNDPVADHVFMTSVAEGSGGRYFNLKQIDDKQIVQQLGLEPFALRNASAADGTVDELFPQRVRPVVLRQSVTGKLSAKQATVELTYGTTNKQHTRSIKVSRADAVEGDLLRRYWAQSKLGDLLPSQKEHRAAIVELGKSHALVTPFTSLLVLDSIEQYVEHRVMPPKSWPELRNEYQKQMKQWDLAKELNRKAKLAKVIPMWKNFCSWYDAEYKYPKNFRYRGEAAKKSDGRPAPGSIALFSLRPEEAAPASPASPAPRRMANTARPSSDASAEEADLVDAFAADFGDIPGGGAAGGGEPFGGEKQAKRGNAKISMTAWDPKTPYLTALKKAKKGSEYARYLELRKEQDYATSPAFYLDCAGFFRDLDDHKSTVRILSNLAELELENPQLLRVLAHRLEQIGERNMALQIFEQVLEMRPEEPQSYRDLALILIARAEDSNKEKRTRDDYARAIELLTEVVMRHWDRFEEIEIMALVEINRILPAARAVGVSNISLDKRLIKPIECDMRITMTWDADNTDIDLHVVEPSGEVAYYSHNRTTIGGRVSRDFTQGYGPEDYMLRKAMRGAYTVKAKYYGSRSVKLLGGVTVQVNIFTNYGRSNQKVKSITVRLVDKEEMITIGKLDF